MGRFKVIYATGSRADYGIVRRYLKLLDEDSRIDLSLLVTGTHIEEKYGNTIDVIRQDGFYVEATFPLQLENLSSENITDAMSIALKEFGRFFSKTFVDLLIVLGDRYEMLSIVIAAAMNKIPILHIHGGEITFGNYDEFIRHSITKMSKYHFASTEEYRRRIIQLGEQPDRVYNLGALGAENSLLYDKGKVSADVLQLQNLDYFIVAFHPETALEIDAKKQIFELLTAIQQVPKQYKFVFLGTNADTNANKIRSAICDFATKYNFVYFENLDSDSYLHLLANAKAIVGNSSSGIIEAPVFQKYTINIGERQKGRVRANSVLDVPCIANRILQAILFVCENAQLSESVCPYYKENTAINYYKKTIDLLEKKDRKPKRFYDLPCKK